MLRWSSASHRPRPGLRNLLRWRRPWQQSLRPGASPLSLELPWITFAAIEFLEATLGPQMRVFEWGSGGSSVFVARRVAHLISVEHDPDWAAQTRQTMQRLGLMPSWTLHVVEPEPPGDGGDADSSAYRSTDASYALHTFRRYARVIDAFPDAAFDVVLIDGRARPSCARHAYAKVRTGGWLVLDNAERSEYAPVRQWLDEHGWKRRDLPGPVPCNREFSLTTAWQRPTDNPAAS